MFFEASITKCNWDNILQFRAKLKNEPELYKKTTGSQAKRALIFFPIERGLAGPCGLKKNMWTTWKFVFFSIWTTQSTWRSSGKENAGKWKILNVRYISDPFHYFSIWCSNWRSGSQREVPLYMSLITLYRNWGQNRFPTTIRCLFCAVNVIINWDPFSANKFACSKVLMAKSTSQYDMKRSNFKVLDPSGCWFNTCRINYIWICPARWIRYS